MAEPLEMPTPHPARSRRVFWAWFAAIAVPALVLVLGIQVLPSQKSSGANLPYSKSKSSSVVITPADIVTLQMFNTSDGVGVGSRDLMRSREYLVVTTDGGVSWRVTGRLPGDATTALPFLLHVAFVNFREGYLESDEPDATIFTDDSGRTWSTVRAPGHPTAMSLDGDDLWIVSDFCRAKSQSCPSRLLIYRFGELASIADVPIPTLGTSPSSGATENTEEANFLDRLGRDAAVFEQGEEGLPTNLLLTTDAGADWQLLSDPCEGLVPSDLAAPSSTRWVLYCQMDGGMNQGIVRFYASSDTGKRWQLTAEADASGDVLGTIGPAMFEDLTISGNGHILWRVGAVFGVSSSGDGGRDWTVVGIQTGGYFANLTTAGATQAWLPVPFDDQYDGLYHTSNGTTRTKLT